MVYRCIVENNRVSCYKVYEEFWYVIQWNKQTYIHYTIKESPGSIKVLWYLSASILAPKWKAQTQELKFYNKCASSSAVNTQD